MNFEMLKYLPLLGVIGKHPNLIDLFNQIADLVQPHVDEIQQAVNEAEAILQKLNIAKTENSNA